MKCDQWFLFRTWNIIRTLFRGSFSVSRCMPGCEYACGPCMPGCASAVGGIGHQATMIMIAIYVYNMESFAQAIGYS